MAVGFFGSEGVESFVKNKLGALVNECDISFVPHDEDIRKAAKQFYRYDVIVRHRDDKDVVLHYKYQLDHHGRMIPDQVADRVLFKMTQRGL
jgi:hypothetical protein